MKILNFFKLYIIFIFLILDIYSKNTTTIPEPVNNIWGLCNNINNNNNNSSLITIRNNFIKSKCELPSSVFVHVHIPKAGGTALSLALTSACNCDKKSHIIPNMCHSCPNSYSLSGDSYPYSISRLTGWKCGPHASLSLLRFAPCEDGVKNSLITRGFKPIYIIMLREPYDRFRSEVLNWCSIKGDCVDWKAGISSNLTFRVLNKIGKGEEYNETALLESHVNLNKHMIIHNRQIKMIGGLKKDFDLNFKNDHPKLINHPKKKYSNQHSIHYSNKPVKEIYDNSIRIMDEYNIIMLIQEKFQESICLLEILYGNMYPFKWNSDKNSHNPSNSYKPTSSDSIIKHQSTVLYKKWLLKNKEDVDFYNYNIEKFDEKFKIALELEKEFRSRDKSRKYRKYTKQCDLYFN